MKTLLLLLLRAFKLGISPFLGQNCRFYPSCSDYAAEAVKLHGALRGSGLAARRLCKCHPWHAGGFDPVPQRQTFISASTCEAPNISQHTGAASSTLPNSRL